MRQWEAPWPSAIADLDGFRKPPWTRRRSPYPFFAGADVASRAFDARAPPVLAPSNTELNAQHREISELLFIARALRSSSLTTHPSIQSTQRHLQCAAMFSRALRVPRALPLSARARAAPFALAVRSVTTDAASSSLSNSVPQVWFPGGRIRARCKACTNRLS